jgi:hypothetical protein
MNKEDVSRTIFGVSRSDGYNGLTPLTDTQEAAIFDTLALTDELDAVYNQQGSGYLFAATFRKAQEKHEDIRGALPNNDLRTNLLSTTLKAYQDVGTLLVGSELNRFQGSTKETMLTARMRKGFLRKIITDELDTEGQDFLNYLLGNGQSKRMGIKIPLLPFTRMPGAKAHPFPLQVSFQTQEFIRGVLFYVMFADVAASEYVRLPDGLNKIKEKLTNEGMTQKIWDDGWAYLKKYQSIFENTVFQNAAILMRSHWDWYIRHIGEFVEFARNRVASPTLSSKQKQQLSRIGWQEIIDQLSILEDSCGISFGISSTISDDIKEMSLVRNLGMHNRWEVDQFYLNKTSSSGWTLKDVRLIDIVELQNWGGSLSKLINETSFKIAEKFAPVPDYP